jgi:tRNA(Ile)-lysidine synthase
VSFKKFCQERGIPPWQRSRIPLLYLDGELAAVADLCLCEGFAAAEGEPGIRVRWTG